MPTKFDAIVIGTGQAGPSLVVRLANAGMRVAVIERKSFGGTCVNTGCIPTKALVASARAAFVAHRSSEWGVSIDGAVRVEMARVKARKDTIVRNSSRGVEQWLKQTANCTVFEGHARLEGPRSVRVGPELLEAERIFLNVGGRAFIPPMPGIDRISYLTNSTMMGVDFLPEHLIVVGGSYVGLEFGQMYRRFGSAVTIVEQQSRLIMREDEDVSETTRQIL
jgi:pyruvate/2-oxoglutarate dehydrogenase complex dihydrolipoamide dehydrogenase (E3) component